MIFDFICIFMKTLLLFFKNKQVMTINFWLQSSCQPASLAGTGSDFPAQQSCAGLPF
jgi:hypothetical protein